MFRILKENKRLRKENSELKRIIEAGEKPLAINKGLTIGEWSELSEDDQIMRIRKLDLILTLKKTRRWDYENNCAKL